MAHADNCDSFCELTLANPVDLSGYQSASLDFWRFLDNGIDNNEYLKVEIFDGNSWNQIFLWTNGQGDDNAWHQESFDLSGYLVSNFNVRFTSKESSKKEEVEIDDILIEGVTPGAECGNNIKEVGEVCDGTDLGGETCSGQGFDGDNLACNPICDGFDTASCYTNTCSDTDGGHAPLIVGTVSGLFQGIPFNNTDFCLSSSVEEYSCLTNEAVSSAVVCAGFDAEYVCLDGACVVSGLNQAPTADAGADQNAQPTQTVNFDGSESFDSDGTIVTYSWDFGDNTTDSGVSVSHSYVDVGVYTVTLTVTDNGGLNDADTATVTVSQGPTLVVSPASTVVATDGNGQLFAVYDPDGSGSQLQQYLDPSLVSWLSDASNIASVDSQGVVSGVSAGVATITSNYSGLQGTSMVKVAGTVSYHSFVTPDGRTRSYLLYVPRNYTGSSTALVLSYHGGGGSSQSMMDSSQLNVQADANTFIIAYPQGASGRLGISTWNSGNCCGYAKRKEVDDVTFSDMVISEISNNYVVDENKVYATGFSNGGMFTHRLACELSDKIAAIAPVAGGISEGGDFISCSPTRDVSVIEFHGTTDDNYPYHGGQGIDGISNVDFYPIVDSADDPGVPDTMDDWLSRNSIFVSSGVASYQNGIETCESFSAPGVEVELCTAEPATGVKVNRIVYDGGGHAWPGGVKGSGSGADIPSADLDAAGRIWQFFQLHVLH